MPHLLIGQLDGNILSIEVPNLCQVDKEQDT